jgi:hypothetical protein
MIIFNELRELAVSPKSSITPTKLPQLTKTFNPKSIPINPYTTSRPSKYIFPIPP